MNPHSMGILKIRESRRRNEWWVGAFSVSAFLSYLPKSEVCFERVTHNSPTRKHIQHLTLACNLLLSHFICYSHSHLRSLDQTGFAQLVLALALFVCFASKIFCLVAFLNPRDLRLESSSQWPTILWLFCLPSCWLSLALQMVSLAYAEVD